MIRTSVTAFFSKFAPGQRARLAWSACWLLLAAPARAQTAEPYTFSNVAIGGGGFVSGILASKAQPGLLYVRTDVGGAYRFDAATGRWVALLDWASENEQGLQGVESLALDPQQPGVLYAQCGISYFNNGRSYILRSADYGATFTYVDVTAQFRVNGNGMGRNNGEKLQVDPVNSAVLYTGTRASGMFKSTDSGSTWAHLDGLNVTTTPNSNGVSFVVLDKGSAAGGATRRIFAGISRTGNDQNFYRSDDAGATFAAVVNPNLAAGMMPQRATFAGPDNLYISYGNGAGPYGTTAEPYNAGQIWKYTVSTGTWADVTPKDAATGMAISNHAFGAIGVDPTNPSRLVASTTNTYVLQGTVYGDRFYYSTDGGTTWTDIIGTRGFSINPDGVTWVGNQSIHWAGCIEFDPANLNHVLVVSGNGIYVNEDITASSVWKFLGKGLEETVAQNAVSIPGGPFISVISDYDGFRQADVTQYGPIHTPRIGSTQGLDYAPLAPGKVVRVGSALYYSTDQGLTWTKTPVINGAAGQVALSADGNVLLHCPNSNTTTTTYRSTDNGTTWTAVTGLAYPNVRPIGDPVNPNKFYAYNPGAGTFFVSTDGGVSFAPAGAGPGTGGSAVVRRVPGREGHLWVALYGGGLARSVNAGAVFTKLANVTYCGAVGIGKAAPGSTYETLYIWGTVGGVLGMHRSTDEGASWVRVNDDAHEYGGPANGQFIMGDMNVYGRVYMSTAGRGIPYGTPAATALATAPAALLDGKNALVAYPNPVENTLTVKLPKTLAGASIAVVNALGQVVRTARAPQADYTLDLSQLAPGLYVVTATNGGKSGSVRFVKK
ncbi:T9SS type A sorting domain-containing protein [Hymenobacter caeli]|uniref:Secretion system C-terminal sorting domain-containing protein n=1 Tax=Hymenobacter caeli TaxID=2735894 RepID=A0ABX2FKB4_9BACT|nr:T9SS type A sorting domain-containing protein [Hymenobacter caeli]NRT17563.1 hypothetical protein [Hymenobacter caeli]